MHITRVQMAPVIFLAILVSFEDHRVNFVERYFHKPDIPLSLKLLHCCDELIQPVIAPY